MNYDKIVTISEKERGFKWKLTTKPLTGMQSKMSIDKSTWEKLTEQFWLDTRIPLVKRPWMTGVNLSAEEKDLVGKVFRWIDTC